MGDRAPFDERAALEELARLREQIEQARSRRSALLEEFHRFVLSFKALPDRADTVPVTRQGRARATRESLPVRSESPPVAQEPPPVAPASRLVATESPPVAPEPLPSSTQPLPSSTGPPRAASKARVWLGGGLILFVGGGLAIWMLRNGASEPMPSASPAPVTRPAPPASAPPAPAPIPAEPLPEEAELTTIRRVWVRVLVDGERVLERELPADARVPLTAQKTIAIRTGDAGAVRLSIGGRDQGFLGREGEVVTRTFTLPAPVR